MSFRTSLRRLLPTCLALTVVTAAGATQAPWQAHAPLPEPRTEVAAGLARGEIVVVGGFIADGGDRRPLKAVFALRQDGFWRQLAPMPDARAAAAAAVSRGTLYVLGGVDGRGGLAGVAFALDLRTGRWARIPGPSRREHLAAAAVGDKVYALGGRSAGIDTNTNRFESYDAKARRWTRLAPIPQARGGTGAASLNGRIVSVGGERPQGTIASVYGYELRIKRWRRLPDLPTPRHGLGVAAAGGRVYVIAGGPQPGLHVSDANEVLTLG